MTAIDGPAVILLCVTLATVFVVVEVALPTLGVAGTLAAAAILLALIGIDRSDATWWPLAGPVIAVVVWLVLLLGRRRSRAAEMAAVSAYAAGGIGFATANGDWPALATAVVGSMVLAAAFPPLHRRTVELLGATAKVGMESLAGLTAHVDQWSDRSGVVLLQGTRWNATADRPARFGLGDPVTVVGHHGNTVEVAPQRTSAPSPKEEP